MELDPRYNFDKLVRVIVSEVELIEDYLYLEEKEYPVWKFWNRGVTEGIYYKFLDGSLYYAGSVEKLKKESGWFYLGDDGKIYRKACIKMCFSSKYSHTRYFNLDLPDGTLEEKKAHSNEQMREYLKLLIEKTGLKTVEEIIKD